MATACGGPSQSSDNWGCSGIPDCSYSPNLAQQHPHARCPMPGAYARCPMPGAPCQVPHARRPSVQLAVLEPCLPGVDTCCLLRLAALWDHEEQCPRVGCSQTPGAYDRLHAQRLGNSILFAFSEQSLRKLSCFPNSTKYICHIMSVMWRTLKIPGGWQRGHHGPHGFTWNPGFSSVAVMKHSDKSNLENFSTQFQVTVHHCRDLKVSGIQNIVTSHPQSKEQCISELHSEASLGYTVRPAWAT